VAAIAAIAQDAYAVYIPVIGRKPEPITVDYGDIVAAGDTWVIDAQGRVIASLVLRDGIDHLLIWSVAVASDHQHQGLGRQLLDWAETQARLRGRPELRLYTNARMTRNIAIYARHGYTQTGREERGDRVLVHMAKKVPR
jgi:ribosomal protein S18 acetylase RimI-like enzyme